MTDLLTLAFYGVLIFGLFALLAFIAESLDRMLLRRAHRARRAFQNLERGLREFEDEAWALRHLLVPA